MTGVQTCALPISLMAVGLMPLWSLAMASASNAGWTPAPPPGGRPWWSAKMGAGSGDVSLNKLGLRLLLLVGVHGGRPRLGRDMEMSPSKVDRQGCSSSGAWSEDDGGSCDCSPSMMLTKGGGAQFRGVRGVSPAVVVHRFSSRRPRARRVSLEVLQLMLPWSLGVGFVVLVAPVLLFL